MKPPAIEFELKNIANIDCYKEENPNKPNLLQRELFGTFDIIFDRKYDTSITMQMKLDEKVADFKLIFKGIAKEKKDYRTSQFLNSKVSKKFLSSLLKDGTLFCSDDKIQFFADAFDIWYNQGRIKTNEKKRKYLIHLSKFMEEYSNFDHTATKRTIGNVVKSVNLSNFVTRRIFKPFFVAVMDLFRSDEEMVETWVSLYNQNSKAELDVVRNAWIKHIKGLAEIKEL